MADIVARHVVDIGVRGKQFGAVIEIHEDDKRVGFSRAMGGETRRELSTHLKRGLPVRCALLHSRH
jgi:hypothetical protein